MVDKEKVYKIYRYWITLEDGDWNYIGRTYLSKAVRAQKGGRSYSHCAKFWPAIQKYGWNNFNYEVLAETNCEGLSYVLEQKCIEFFDSINHGFNRSTGGLSGATGIHWNRTEESKAHLSEALLNRLDCSKKIIQLDMEGNFIKEFPSIQEASRQTGIPHQNIVRALKGRAHSAGNSKWNYKA